MLNNVSEKKYIVRRFMSETLWAICRKWFNSIEFLSRLIADALRLMISRRFFVSRLEHNMQSYEIVVLRLARNMIFSFVNKGCK